MGTGRLRARAAIAALLLAIAGCGSSAVPTIVANPLPTAPAGGTPGNSASPTIVAVESPATATDTPTAGAGQHWTGTITSTSERHYFDGGANYTCSDAWTGTLAFTVDGQNTVTGSGALNLNDAESCTNPYAMPGQHGAPPPVLTRFFSVSGVETTAGFTLQFKPTGTSPPLPGAVDVAGITSLLVVSACPPVSGPKLSIVLDRQNHATGSPVLSVKLVQNCPNVAQGGANDVFSTTSTIVLNSP